MPYIPKFDRERAAQVPHPLKPGELTYALTKLTLDWIGDKPTYTELNDAIGALECSKLELYRRMVAPYEDAKIAENGDVYPHKAAAREARSPRRPLSAERCSNEDCPICVHGHEADCLCPRCVA